MDKVWRFFRTVAWGAVGVVAVTSVLIPVLNAANIGDWPGLQVAVVVGGLTTLGAGILAVLQAAVLKDPITVAQRVLNQFLQTVIAGIPAPFLADSLLDTAVNYGRAWWSLVLVSIVSAAQSWVVNAREADPTESTPLPVGPAVTD